MARGLTSVFIRCSHKGVSLSIHPCPWSVSAATAHALRELLEKRFPGTVPLVYRTAPVAPTGIGALDVAFPDGGLPRGRFSAWALGGGATAVLLTACRAALVRGERAVWIDARGTATGAVWAGGPVLVRPGGGEQATRCAEELARSGGFGLVVLAADTAADQDRVRLSRAVREGGGALVVLSENGFMAGARVVSRVAPGGVVWRRGLLGEPLAVDVVHLRVRVRSLGWDREAAFPLSFSHYEHRLSLEPTLADRRGTRH